MRRLDNLIHVFMSCTIKKRARNGRTTLKSIFIHLQNLHLLRLSRMLTCLMRYSFITLKINLIFFPCIVLRANAVTIILIFKQAFVNTDYLDCHWCNTLNTQILITYWLTYCMKPTHVDYVNVFQHQLGVILLNEFNNPWYYVSNINSFSLAGLC